MKTVKPIDENELMELMAGKQPTPAPAIATAPIETEKTPQKLAHAKKKKAELYEYESIFLSRERLQQGKGNRCIYAQSFTSG